MNRSWKTAPYTLPLSKIRWFALLLHNNLCCLPFIRNHSSVFILDGGCGKERDIFRDTMMQTRHIWQPLVTDTNARRRQRWEWQRKTCRETTSGLGDNELREAVWWALSKHTLYTRRSDGTVIRHLYVVGQHGVLCEVKWWRFVALFE